MKKLLLSAAAILAVFIIADTALGQLNAPAWTSIGTAGTPRDPASFALVGTDDNAPGNLIFAPGASGVMEYVYNVVNTAVRSGGLSTGKPPWTTLEIAYIMPDASETITATLYGQLMCDDKPFVICQIVVTSPTATVLCDHCTFPKNTFNYLTTIYFIDVKTNKPSAGLPTPTVCSLRIYNL